MKKMQRKIESRNKILDSAAEYFTEHGIGETDIDEICRKAGLTRGAFYHHFPTKQQFLLELLEKWINKMDSQLSSLQYESSNPVEILTEISDNMQPVFEQAGKQIPIFLELYIKAVNDPTLKEYVLKSYYSFLLFLKDAVDKNKDKKAAENDDAETEDIAKILFAVTVGLLIQGLIAPGTTDWAKLAKKSIRLILE